MRINLLKEYVYTPWGQAQQIEHIAEGIDFYTTASHGGYKISAERKKTMPEPYRSHKTFAGGLWYEEDCDWAVIALSFPDEVFKYNDPEKKAMLLEKAMKTWEWMQERNAERAKGAERTR
jgi:hypothetical protein